MIPKRRTAAINFITKSITCLLILANLEACSQASKIPAESSLENAQSPRLKPVTGWRTLKLGMDFDSARAAMPESRWNDNELKVCARELKTNGCPLTQVNGVTDHIDGAEFKPSLYFNNRGILIDIKLTYELERTSTNEQCIDVLERTIESVVAEYGPMAGSEQKLGRDVIIDDRKTKSGIAYRLHEQPSHMYFLLQPMRGQLKDTILPTKLSTEEWNDESYVSIDATFFRIINLANCKISIEYSLPRKQI